MTVEMNTSGMIAGDTAGLALLSAPYAWIGVVKTAAGWTLQMIQGRGGGGRRGGGRCSDQLRPAWPNQSPAPPVVACRLQLRHRQGHLQLEADGKQFTPLGNPFTMTFQLTTFQGVRPALFNFNTVRPAWRLCRLWQLYRGRATRPRHRARDPHGPDHRADQRRRWQLPGRRYEKNGAGQCRGRRGCGRTAEHPIPSR